MLRQLSAVLENGLSSILYASIDVTLESSL